MSTQEINNQRSGDEEGAETSKKPSYGCGKLE